MLNYTKITAILSLFCLLFWPLAHADSKNFTDPQKSITVSKDQPEFIIALASNPTTGYSWFIYDYNPLFLVPIKHVYNPPTSQLVGAGGSDTWTFKLNPLAFKAPHLIKIKMLYARPWDLSDQNKFTEFNVLTQ